jgi:hypothetical protein
MTKKLTAAQLRMAALGNHMMEAGAELYQNPDIVVKIKRELREDNRKKES